MGKKTFFTRVLTVVILAEILFSGVLYAEIIPLEIQEQNAFNAVKQAVAPSVVRIETTGGAVMVGKEMSVMVTTGVIISEDGYVVSSLYGFIHEPNHIIVQVQDGTRYTAKIAAVDKNRVLVLLKMNIPESIKLQPATAATRDSFRVGQWTLTLGRVLDKEKPSLTVGVLSAVNRIWGKAIQTDAAVSANNYGGPLCDIYGRVMGILTPMNTSSGTQGGIIQQKKTPGLPQMPGPGKKGSPEEPADPSVQENTGILPLPGADWYDSGIAFAIPLEDILKILPRWKSEECFQHKNGGCTAPIGIAFKEPDPSLGNTEIGEIVPKSQADSLGLKKGDVILKVNGNEVYRAADILDIIRACYPGDTVIMEYVRGKEPKKVEMKLKEAEE